MGPVPDRRENIVTHSSRLFAKKGIAATTVREIGDAAGVLSGSLYHHFKSKNEIVGEILRRFMADITRRFDSVVENSGSPEDTVRGLINETLAAIDEHPYATAMYQNDRRYLQEHGLLEPVKSSSRAVRDHWIDAIRAGVAAGTFRDDIPVEVFYRTVRDSLWASMHWTGRASYLTSDFAGMMTSLFFQGFAAHRS